MLRSKIGFTAMLGSLGVLLSMSGCLRAIDAGHEGVLVKQPFFFGHGGVDPVPTTTGRVLVAGIACWSCS